MYGHPENHEVVPINDRDNLDFFPEQFRVAIISIRQTFAEKPTLKLINDFVAHQDALLQYGECTSTQRYSLSVKTFLTVPMDGTSGFTQSSGLANVKKYAHEKGLSKATVIQYLSSSSKSIDYFILHRSREYPSISETRWSKVIKELRIPFQRMAQKEKRVVQREKFTKVPTFREVKRLNNKISSVRKRLTAASSHVSRIASPQFFILARRLNCRAGQILALT